jgi:hypothetical protein
VPRGRRGGVPHQARPVVGPVAPLQPALLMLDS